MGTYIVIVLDFLIIGVGYLYYKTFVNKCVFWGDLVSLSQSLSNSILLQNKPVSSAIEEYNFKNKNNKALLLKNLNLEIKENENNTNKEFKDIFGCFNLIASSFGEQTKEHIKTLETLANEKLAITTKLKKEKGMLYFKLSIILALAFTILVM